MEIDRLINQAVISRVAVKKTIAPPPSGKARRVDESVE